MGQSITPSRVADFVRAYSPEKQSEPEGTETLGAVEAEMSGTGHAPALVGPGRAPSRKPSIDPEAATAIMPEQPEPPRSHGLLYGIATFAAIAVVGGGIGYVMLVRGEEPQPVPVETVNLAAVVPGPKAPETAPQVEPIKPPAAIAETIKPPEPAQHVETAPSEPPRVAEPPKQTAPEPRPRMRRVAAKQPDPQAPPVVIVKEEPKPAPTVVAKGELVLLIRPWAKVEVDGQEFGVTPLSEPIQLAAGDHQVRLINPDLGKDVTRTVHIKPSETNTVRVLLDE